MKLYRTFFAFLVLISSVSLFGETLTSPNRDQLKKIQQTLKQKGFDPGPIDGRMGPRTAKAISRFQSKNQLSATGQLDPQTVKRLEAAGPPSAPTNLRVQEVSAE